MSPTGKRSGSGPNGSLRSRLEQLRGSETAKAAGLALAMIVNNVIALLSTVVFARLLDDYGSLAALISYFLILSVADAAMQVATAREGVLGHLGVGAGLLATIRRWTRSMLIFTAVLTVLSILFRQPIADAVGVKKDAWAAAIGIPAGCLWLELSILRGALQGVGDYKSVGLSLILEQSVRLIAGATLAAVGLGVTGAYLGTPISFIAICFYCWNHLRRIALVQTEAGADGAALEPAAGRAEGAFAGASTDAERSWAPASLALWTHVRRAWAPIAGLIVIAVLQNIDIIAAKHRFTKSLASSYGATAVAAKVLIWVAIGAGFYLVPEVSRRRAAGEDPRPVLMKALGIILVCAIPCLLIFAVAPHLLLKLAFGEKRTGASDSLIVLGAAFTVLAATYLAIQYMLALKRTWFLIAIGVVAVLEPILLLQASRKPANFAAVVLAIQAVGAVVAFGAALSRRGAPASTDAGSVGPPAAGDGLAGGPELTPEPPGTPPRAQRPRANA
ncbi:MAG: lipopolysaccharide biosynthesis protein [Solirubrobacteraceae bacterium]